METSAESQSEQASMSWTLPRGSIMGNDLDSVDASTFDEELLRVNFHSSSKVKHQRIAFEIKVRLIKA